MLSFVAATAVQHRYSASIINCKENYVFMKQYALASSCLTLQCQMNFSSVERAIPTLQSAVIKKQVFF